MIEIPEAESLSRQLNQTINGKIVARVIAGFSPHKFAWYHGNPVEAMTSIKAGLLKETQPSKEYLAVIKQG